MCHDTRYNIKNTKHCPVNLIRSQHAFYQKMIFTNPIRGQVSTKIVTGFHQIEINDQHMKKNVTLDLPFPFLFYGIYFNKITISPLGYIILLLKKNSNATIKNASIMVYLNAFDILHNALQCIISYGSSSVGMDDLVIKWDDSYEVIFHKNNRIDMKYLKTLPEK